MANQYTKAKEERERLAAEKLPITISKYSVTSTPEGKEVITEAQNILKNPLFLFNALLAINALAMQLSDFNLLQVLFMGNEVWANNVAATAGTLATLTNLILVTFFNKKVPTLK